MSSFLRTMLYGGLDKDRFVKAQDSLIRKNCQMLYYTSTICLLLFLGMLLSSFFNSNTDAMNDLRMRSRIVYALLFSICTAVAVLCKLLRNKRPRQIVGIWYAFLSVLYAFSIWAGTFNQPAYPAVTFFVFLFALPLLIVERPIRIVPYLVSVSVIFLICSYRWKAADMFELDFLNCLCFCFLSISLSVITMKNKYNEVVQKMVVEEQRDLDPLTGLMNKIAIRQEISKALRENEKGYLLMIDIDDFKLINDRYGHLFGDTVIRTFANCLTATFSESAKIGRFGGDEFIVFLKGVDSEEELLRQFRIGQEKMKESVRHLEQGISLRMSAGAVFCQGNGTEEYDTLLILADKALYQAKQEGKDHVRAFVV